MNRSCFREVDGNLLRCGYTTGSCAAAAAKAAVKMLLGEPEQTHVWLMTPKGIPLCLEILEIRVREASVSCAVRKDAGDDPDVTDGALVYAEVFRSAAPGVRIEGGEGIGIVTRPGLDQPIGNAAINSTPRRMIREAVLEAAASVSDEGSGKTGLPTAPSGGFRVVISIPAGKALAEKTFNPKLGILGGISVLGTSGIVEPMSDEALLHTIRTEIRVRRAECASILVMVPGNYGRSFLEEACGISPGRAVECSNFAADAVQMAADAGFQKLLLIGHIGKLVKIAGGVRNTHSRYGDRRMEITAELAAMAQPETEARICKEIKGCISMDEAVGVLRAYGADRPVLQEMAERVKHQLEAWSEGRLKAEAVLFSNRFGALGVTRDAGAWIEELRER